MADAGESLVKIRPDRGALERMFLRALGMAAREEPEFLSRFGEHEVDEVLRGLQVRGAFENADAVGVDRREISGQGEYHVRRSRHADLARPVKVDRERVSRFTKRHVLRRRTGLPIKIARVAANLSQRRPPFFPPISLEKRLIHDVHRGAVPGVAGPDPSTNSGISQFAPARHGRKTDRSLNERVLQNAETGYGGAEPVEIRIVKFHPAKRAGKAVEDVRTRAISGRE